MNRIVWLASFLKSGNTWLRFLLANYFHPNNTEGIHINQMALGRLANSRWIFDEWSALEGSDLSDQEIDRCRADVFRAVSTHATGPVFLKTHEAWYRNDAGQPVFPAEATLAVIYVVRNPLDVAVSMAPHMNVSIGTAVELMCDATLTLGPDGDGITTRFPQHVGSWTSHARSWLDESGLPIVLVRYEDLRADTAAAFVRILQALGAELDYHRVEQAVRFAAFDRLRQQELEAGFVERCSRSELFFRGGRVGDGDRELSKADRQRLIGEHGKMMTRLGYSPSATPK